MSTRSARRPWGTFVLWVIAGLGFVYLFTPLVTIIIVPGNMVLPLARQIL